MRATLFVAVAMMALTAAVWADAGPKKPVSVRKPPQAIAHSTHVAPEAPQDLMIPLGRVQIFGEQEQQAMADLKAEVEDDSHNPHSLYGKLFVAVWIHNVNVQRACEEKIVSRKVCRSARVHPWWLKEPGTVVYSYKSLTRFVDEAQMAMTPFWSELCAGASKAKGEELKAYCPME